MGKSERIAARKCVGDARAAGCAPEEEVEEKGGGRCRCLVKAEKGARVAPERRRPAASGPGGPAGSGTGRPRCPARGGRRLPPRSGCKVLVWGARGAEGDYDRCRRGILRHRQVQLGFHFSLFSLPVILAPGDLKPRWPLPSPRRES